MAFCYSSVLKLPATLNLIIMAEDQSQLNETLDKVLQTAKEISEQQSQLFGRALEVQSSLAGTVITGVNEVMKKLAVSASEALDTVSSTIKKENQ